MSNPAKNPKPAIAKTLAVEMVNQINKHLQLVKSVEDSRLLSAQQEAENALSMALHYLREGANVPGAMRKTIQAMGAMNTLQAAGAGKGGAA